MKFNKPTTNFFGFLILSMIVSCSSYTIPVDSFRKQMVKADLAKTNKVKINNPLTYGNITYFSNNIDRLVVLDKNGKELYLDNSPSIEMRVTQRNGKRNILYFDTVILENDTLKGGRSRFIQGLTKQIPMDNIVKIEVQDGGKKFSYEN